jgi:hypothetical protein
MPRLRNPLRVTDNRLMLREIRCGPPAACDRHTRGTSLLAKVDVVCKNGWFVPNRLRGGTALNLVFPLEMIPRSHITSPGSVVQGPVGDFHITFITLETKKRLAREECNRQLQCEKLLFVDSGSQTSHTMVSDVNHWLSPVSKSRRTQANRNPSRVCM